jgi:hypothetical protein
VAVGQEVVDVLVWDTAAVAYDEDLADRLRRVLADEPGLSEKRMFGGLAFLVDGNMAVAASGQGGLLLRVDPAASRDLVGRRGVVPFVMRGRPMEGWVRVEASSARTTRQVAGWTRIGVAYARSLPPKRAAPPATAGTARKATAGTARRRGRSLDDVALIALALPGVTEGRRHGLRSWSVAGKVFAWERTFSKADLRRFGDRPPPPDPILAVRMADLDDKEAVLAAGTRGVFTIPHFDGYAAVLVELVAVAAAALREVVLDGWLAVAPPALAGELVARRRRRDVRP